MRDLVAGVIAIALLLVAASLATTLRIFRKRRMRARAAERERGRVVIAEIPAADDLVLVSEDPDAFHYGDRVILKASIAAARVLINGAPIAAVLSTRHASAAALHPTSFEDRPEGIARDRWDVALETTAGTVLVECGAIRERVSQELARAVFEAVKRDVEARNASPPTSGSREARRDD
jgi:hypothetical protein